MIDDSTFHVGDHVKVNVGTHRFTGETLYRYGRIIAMEGEFGAIFRIRQPGGDEILTGCVWVDPLDEEDWKQLAHWEQVERDAGCIPYEPEERGWPGRS